MAFSLHLLLRHSTSAYKTNTVSVLSCRLRIFMTYYRQSLRDLIDERLARTHVVSAIGRRGSLSGADLLSASSSNPTHEHGVSSANLVSVFAPEELSRLAMDVVMGVEFLHAQKITHDALSVCVIILAPRCSLWFRSV
jgi:hypothetical protein